MEMLGTKENMIIKLERENTWSNFTINIQKAIEMKHTRDFIMISCAVFI